MRTRVNSGSSHISIEKEPNMVSAFYSVGKYEKVVARACSEQSDNVEMTVICRNGDIYNWTSANVYLVGYMMYGIPITPWGNMLFAQQYSGGLFCLNIENGQHIWKANTRAEISHVLVNKHSLCCSKGRNELVILNVATGEITKKYKVPFDNRFIAINNRFIINHSRANCWEVIDSESLSVMEVVHQRDVELDVDRSLWNRLCSEYGAHQ